jgi:hypothetical protein
MMELPLVDELLRAACMMANLWLARRKAMAVPGRGLTLVMMAEAAHEAEVVGRSKHSPATRDQGD